jgi:photosystem II stability/assembly factor-like uncharacterized protein
MSHERISLAVFCSVKAALATPVDNYDLVLQISTGKITKEKETTQMLKAIQEIAFITVIICAAQLYGAVRPGNFTVLGPGGGGAMFNPTISPHDPNTVLVSCDMTGAYITHDGGQTWRMFNLRDVVRFFVFDPMDPKTIYAGTQALWRSTDAGETWSLLYPKPSTIRGIHMDSDHSDETVVAEPDPLGTIVALAVDPNDYRVLHVVSKRENNFVVSVSSDSGDSWKEFGSLQEAPLGIEIDPHSASTERALIAVTAKSVTVLTSARQRSFPTPVELNGAALGFLPGGQTIIYGISKWGLFVSRNGGADWQEGELSGRGEQLRAIATSRDHPEIAYLSYADLQETGAKAKGVSSPPRWMGVAKTSDMSKTWKLIWKEANQAAANVHDAWITPRFGPGWPESPLALGVSDKDPNLVYATDLGRTMRSSDGGRNWTAVYSRKLPQQEWTSTGLDVTTNYGVHFDPFDRKREFITYTDIGLFRSEDGGQSWQSSTAGVPKNWVNTTYWVVFDPKVRGRLWSVNSGTHDLPRPKMWRHNSVLQYRGGVCRSDDGGRTWTKSNRGMDETAPTHILLDPDSPTTARVLYVAAFGRGVYKSSDNGRTWTLKNNGISQSEPFAWRLVRDAQGTLYVILARRSEDGSIGNPGDGAIYRSRDHADSWEPLTLPAGVNGPNGLLVDPHDPKRLYLAAWARAAGMHGEGGGIFLSADGGQSWRRVLDRDRHVYDVTIDPDHPDRLYAAGFESSAWLSQDRGEHWSRIPGFNFKWGHRVIPDPEDSNSVYVTTFGGSVWHGSMNGNPAPVDIATPEMQPGTP